MLHKCIVFCLLICLSITTVFSYEQYVDQDKRNDFYTLVNERLWDKIGSMPLQTRVKLIVKIEKLLATYESQDMPDTKKTIHVNLLLALQDFVEESIVGNQKESEIEIIVIDDKRCQGCGTAEIIQEIQQSWFFDTATYTYKDFSEEGVKTYMENNNISYLPALIFSTNDVSEESGMKPYLQPLSDGKYTLQIGATFDPYSSISSRWFKILEKEILDSLYEGSYMSWDANAEITWLEYSDLQCFFCAKLHNSGTIDQVRNDFGGDINFVFHHFPLAMHPDAYEASEVLECIGKEHGGAAFYDSIDVFFQLHATQWFSKKTVYAKVSDMGYDVATCVEWGSMKSKIDAHLDQGTKLFGATGTPTSVIINNTTGEYVVIPGAYPYETFVSTIESLLQ